VPVGFDFDGEYLYVSGMNLLKSTKFRNVLKNNRVAIVVDDLKSIDPWDPRGIRIYGTADVITRQGGYPYKSCCLSCSSIQKSVKAVLPYKSCCLSCSSIQKSVKAVLPYKSLCSLFSTYL